MRICNLTFSERSGSELKMVTIIHDNYDFSSYNCCNSRKNIIFCETWNECEAEDSHNLIRFLETSGCKKMMVATWEKL